MTAMPCREVHHHHKYAIYTSEWYAGIGILLIYAYIMLPLSISSIKSDAAQNFFNIALFKWLVGVNKFLKLFTVPVVPHKAVAEVSEFENQRRGWLL